MDLIKPFYSRETSKSFFTELVNELDERDPAIIVLALEGFHRLDASIKRGQFSIQENTVRQFTQLVTRGHCSPLPLSVVSNSSFRQRHDSLNYSIFLQSVPTKVDGRDVCQDLLPALRETNSAVAVLVLEGVYQSDGITISGQALWEENCRDLLRNWRRHSPILQYGYYGIRNYLNIKTCFRNLTVFNTFQVPLFTGDCGAKRVPAEFGIAGMELIDINESTVISHVTHADVSEMIENDRLLPSNNRNVVSGSWFGFLSTTSVYGTKSYSTTLGQLGVTGLYQGEIVSYQQEVNVILYAAADGRATFGGLVKPIQDVAREVIQNQAAYVKVSIFVPCQFIPDTPQTFRSVFTGPVPVRHGPICVGRRDCEEIDC